MAREYNKKIYVTPDLQINVSKGDDSNVFGVRKGSAACRNGLYVNTGIPGTGFYSRNQSNGENQNAPLSYNSTSDGIFGGGCLVTSIVCAVVLGISAIVEGFVVLGIIGLVFGCVLAIISHSMVASSEVNISDVVSTAETALSSASGDKAVILQNFLSCFQLSDKLEDEAAIITELERRLSKKSDEALDSLLCEHKRIFDELKQDLQNVQVDVDGGLTEAEEDSYSSLCESFESLMKTKCIWSITEISSTSQAKSWAKTTVQRSKASLFAGVFNFIKSGNDIPAFDFLNKFRIYLYPKYIIRERSAFDFDVYPYTLDTITVNMVEFQEDGTNFPSDAQFVKYVWKYVNKKGGPDRRFSDNPQYPVYRYAYITIKLGGDCVNFLVSNASAANEFANKYNDYISTQDLETEEGESHHDKKSCDDKKQSRVERSSYDNFKTAATNLYSYLKKMGNMDAVISALDEQEISIPDSIAFTINPKLAVVALIDVIKCYKGLGYKIDLSQPEGIGLAILAIRLLVADCNMVIDSEELLKSKGVAPADKFIKSFDSAIKTSYDGDGFYVAEILRSGGVDDDVVNKYIVLLYRFALVLAKTDGVITQNESNWLANIMRFSNDNNKKRKEMVASNSVAGRSDSSRKDGNAIDQLNSLIGLDSVKNEVTKLSNFIKVQQLRQQKGLNTSPISYHCVFTGNPGTGKTTVARILSEIYRDLGILKNGHLVETDRSGLVAEYVGQTAVKTNKIIDSALDGVLFIDEAYSLLQGGSNDYGMEAVATLLKRMEDDRDRLIVILAGYSDDMKKFIESNPGLQSRFNRYIEFEDYTAVNLYDIFVLNARKYDYDLSDGAHDKLKSLFERAVSKKDKNFGNGRFARNILEKTLENQAMRLSLISNITEENLRTIEDDDIPDY